MCLITKDLSIMKDSDIHILLSRWLEDPGDPELNQEIQSELKGKPEIRRAFEQLQMDYDENIKAEIPDNPFFFSKLKSRMEGRKEEKAHVQRVRWAVYAATMSLSMVFGVLLGNKVDSNSSIEEDTILTEELVVGDYNIDDAYLLEIEE